MSLRRTLLYILLCALPLLNAGCFLRLLFGSVAQRDTEFGSSFVAEIGGQWGPLAICDFEENDGTLVDCVYTFLDLEGEFEITVTSSAELISQMGILGVFVDPLVVQVPADAVNFVATFDDGAGPQAVVITEVNSFEAQSGTSVVAEPGRKFVILEFPADVVANLMMAGQLSGPFDFDFEFEVPSLSAVEVKPMFTGKVEVDGQTFYPPMLPCVTDFADVPALTIPVSQAAQDLMPQVLNAAAVGCDGQVYSFLTGPGDAPIVGIPTLGEIGLLILLCALAGIGLIQLRRYAAQAR